MPSINAIFQYPFDNTGLANTNKVTAEQHTVNSVNGYRDYQLVVPRWAPFFENDVRLRFVHNTTPANNRDLVFGVDYIFTHRFVTASKACAKPVFGSILLLNPNMEGIVVIDNYQTIGGEWTIDETQILEILANVIHNPRLTSWESVNNIPYYFPVQDHDWRVEDMVGMSDVVNSIAGIEEAIRQSSSGSINTHVQDLANPHQVTKAQVLLGNVMNYPMATTLIAETGTSLAHYMSPAMSKALIIKETAIFRDHLAIISGNPHGLTAGMINAYTTAEVDQLIEDLRNTGLAASDTIRFDGKTAEEYRDWALSGGVGDSLMFAGRDWNTAFDEIRANIPIANVSGAVSQTDFDQAMLGKLGTNEQAADTRAFGALDVDDYKAWVLQGTAADTDMIFGMDQLDAGEWVRTMAGGGSSSFKYEPDLSTGTNTDVWTYLGKYVAIPDVNQGSFSIFVEGGESDLLTAGGLYNVSVSHVITTEPVIRIKKLNANPGNVVRFCYITTEELVDDGLGNITSEYTYSLYMRTDPRPLSIDITRISAGNGQMVRTGQEEQLIVEPANPIYVDIENQFVTDSWTYQYSRTEPLVDAGYSRIAKVNLVEKEFITGSITADSALVGDTYSQTVDYKLIINQDGEAVLTTINSGSQDKLAVVVYQDSAEDVNLYVYWGSNMLKNAYHHVNTKSNSVVVDTYLVGSGAVSGTQIIEQTKTSSASRQVLGLGTVNIVYTTLGANVGPMSLIQVMVLDPDAPIETPVWFDALNFCSIARNSTGISIINDTTVDLDIEVIVR